MSKNPQLIDISKARKAKMSKKPHLIDILEAQKE